MKKIITNSCFALAFLGILAVLTGQMACQKATTNCTAVVLITDVNNQPVSNVSVRLYAPNAQVQGNGVTNGSGSVSFSFALPAIFNIAATKAIAANDTLHGSGIIQVQAGQTASATVVVK